MANNRLYLACQECGQGVMIAKFYPSGGWTYQEPAMAAWFTKHDHGLRDMYGNYQFVLLYQMAEDGGVITQFPRRESED